MPQHAKGQAGDGGSLQKQPGRETKPQAKPDRHNATHERLQHGRAGLLPCSLALCHCLRLQLLQDTQACSTAAGELLEGSAAGSRCLQRRAEHPSAAELQGPTPAVQPVWVWGALVQKAASSIRKEHLLPAALPFMSSAGAVLQACMAGSGHAWRGQLPNLTGASAATCMQRSGSPHPQAAARAATQPPGPGSYCVDPATHSLDSGSAWCRPCSCSAAYHAPAACPGCMLRSHSGCCSMPVRPCTCSSPLRDQAARVCLACTCDDSSDTCRAST